MTHQPYLSDCIPCGSVKTVAGKTVTLKIRADTLTPTLFGAIEGLADNDYQVLDRPDDVRVLGRQDTPLGRKVIAAGGTHIAKLGYGKTLATLVIDEATAAHLKSLVEEARSQAIADRKAAETVGWDEAERACPEGHVPAVVKWTNGDLCAHGVITRDGIELTVSDTVAQHRGYVWVPAADVAAKRDVATAASARRETRAAELATAAVPPEAVQAYSRYRGDAEAAWTAEDETAWGLIRRHGAAIAAQGLAGAPVTAPWPEPRPEDVADHAGE